MILFCVLMKKNPLRWAFSHLWACVIRAKQVISCRNIVLPSWYHLHSILLLQLCQDSELQLSILCVVHRSQKAKEIPAGERELLRIADALPKNDEWGNHTEIEVINTAGSFHPSCTVAACTSIYAHIKTSSVTTILSSEFFIILKNLKNQ